jgi:hypothetical protein
MGRKITRRLAPARGKPAEHLQWLMLDEGGNGLPGERSGIGPGRSLCTGGTFTKLRYSHKNIITPSAPTNTQLTNPTPRNTIAVQVRIGRQIAVLEEETHKE